LEELGYTLTFQRAAAAAGGGTFMISHRLGADPDAPPIHIVASDQDLDRRGDAARSAHALVQDYLNRSNALWGIVTNGLTLRLLRNTVRFSKPSYIEFDLEAIFKGNLYSELVLFYRLVHATRLPRGAGDAHECWLEKYYQQGIEQGGRVRDRLREGVEKALEILGTGLLAHPESSGLRAKFESERLTKIHYYRQLLRLIYRLLFLMVAEERRLLFMRDSETADRQAIYDRWYSIERLRKRTDSRFFDDGHSDLWEGLKQTFRLFEDAAAASQLGLTALDGELFGRFACADLIDTERELGPKLRNDQLLSAIWYLSTFEDSEGRRASSVRRRVNFAGLDVEELGSVYESLLEYHPEVKIESERSKFELVTGTERKSTGSYYTPPELVRELIQSALEPVIEDRVAKAKTRDNKESALLALKICDPASGSGHFMLAAARRLGRELARARSGEAEPNPADYRKAVRDVIRRCIYAVDKNPLAVDLCKVALWIEGHEPGLPLSFLDHHIKCGDSLVGIFDLDVLRTGVPDDAYKAVTGDDRAVANDIKKRNRTDTKGLFRYSIQDRINRIAGAFAAIADLPETTPDQVRAKEIAYAGLRQGEDWGRAKSACDLWTTAFFAPLTVEGAVAVPTTRHVWEAAGGNLGQKQVTGLALDLAYRQPFFHWPLEFPEVFACGGFDVMLGNPPWEVSQFSDSEFFKSRAPQIAGLAGAKRKAAIDSLAYESPELWSEFQGEKHRVESENKFLRSSGRFVLSAHGKLNTYAIFAETFLRSVGKAGRAGFIVPTGIATDDGNKEFISSMITRRTLVSLLAFENEEFIFPSVHHSFKFCLLTISGDTDSNRYPVFCFFARKIEHVYETRRRFTLSPDDIAILNPNTRTCPIFRSQADFELTRKIFGHFPVFINSQVNNRDRGATWQPLVRQNFFSHSTDSQLFHTAKELVAQNANREGVAWRTSGGGVWLPLYEAKMVHAYDHRAASYAARGEDRGFRVLPPSTAEDHQDPTYSAEPFYWVELQQVDSRLGGKWDRAWFLGWRDVTTAISERTVIAAVIPKSATDDSFSLLLLGAENKLLAGCLLANLNSIPLDYFARQKVGGTHLRLNTLAQLPILPPNSYSEKDVAFANKRTLELTYTAEDVRSFAEDLGFYGPPFSWEPQRRALLRAELDAYYAYLYGLTRRELEYILDPKAVMAGDYPSETFRVLKENEIKEFGEYRSQRLVLESWDRFAADGTFDPARLREPQYIDRLAQELTTTRAKLEQLERDSNALLTLARASPTPTLFVEGVTDAKIIEAAWAIFFPKEPMPVKVIGAGGTKEMGSLAGKGKALREVLSDQVVLVLADNDSAGRQLTEDGHVRKGGTWRQLPNGIHWCLLRPTAAFAAAMKTHNVPPDYWPFTIEAAFSPALRRQAEAAGAWRFSGTPQAELLDNPDLARRLFAVVPKLSPDDDAYWYLMAPHPEAKEAFAAWVTAPKQLTEENFAAFEEIVRGLRALLARDDSVEAAARIRGAA
jgi:type I restriction-modification system DNA methylase subunit